MMIAPLTVAATWSACVNASRAGSRNSARAVTGSRSAAATAPASVSGPRHVAAVDRSPDRAEQRDPECAAELRAGLGDPRRRPGALGRRTAHREIGRQREQGREPERQDHGPGDDRLRAARRRGLGQLGGAQNRHDEPAQHHRRGPKPCRQRRRELRADDEGDGRRHAPDARLERREAEHQLQVLGDEDLDPEGDRESERIGAERDAERPPPEQLEVDHRIGQPALAVDEQRGRARARRARERRPPRQRRRSRWS